MRDLHHLPFDGDIDWEGLAARLRQTGYAGSVALEVQAFTGYEERMTADAYPRQGLSGGGEGTGAAGRPR